MRSQMPQPHGLITMQPRTPDSSAMSAAEITSWYQAAKSSSRLMVRAWRMADIEFPETDDPRALALDRRAGKLLAQLVELALHLGHLLAQRVEIAAALGGLLGGGLGELGAGHEGSRRGLEHGHVGFGHLGERVRAHARLPGFLELHLVGAKI